MSDPRGGKPRPSQGPPVKNPPSPTNPIRKIIADEMLWLRGQIGDMFEKMENDVNVRFENAELVRNITDRITLLASFATFFVTMSIFFFTGHDIFDVISLSQNVDTKVGELLKEKSSLYRNGGIGEAVAAGVTAAGIAFMRRQYETRALMIIFLIAGGAIGITTFALVTAQIASIGN